MDAVLLARLQFALTISFHFLFPPISIGIAWFLVYTEWRAWRTGNPLIEKMSRLLARLFVITFALGVATGLTMEFQFGTNWAAYSRFVGDIFGAPLAAEGLFAFFLESSFLGLYIFGRNKIPRGLLWFSILMVAIGTTLSAFWILTTNSWMQTPQGFELQDGRVVLTDFTAAMFNPSMLPRFFHTLTACIITGMAVILGVFSYFVLQDLKNGPSPEGEASKMLYGPALAIFIIASLLEIFPFGHSHALQVARTQPEKFASMEGILETGSNVPALVFGIPVSQDPPEIKARIEIPSLVSYLVHGSKEGVVQGLSEWPPEDRPPLALTFIAFHLMVILGGFFVFLGLLGGFFFWKKKLFSSRFLLWLFVLGIPLPTIATQAGWVTAEVGRQPWVVYRLLRTSDAVSITVGVGDLIFSLTAFVLIYSLLFWLYLDLMISSVKKGFSHFNSQEDGYGS